MRGNTVTRVIATASFRFVLSDDNQGANGVVPDIGLGQQPARVRVSEGVSLGLLANKVAPVYPYEAKQAHIQGPVILRAIISKEGRRI
jgi:hypothetical protein